MIQTPRVFIYWNLHKACFSILCREGEEYGHVVAHATEFALSGCQFFVSETVRARVRRTRKKEVHAGIVGRLVAYQGDQLRDNFVGPSRIPRRVLNAIPHGRHVTYNPMKHESFIDVASKQPVTVAAYVYGNSSTRQVITISDQQLLDVKLS